MGAFLGKHGNTIIILLVLALIAFLGYGLTNVNVENVRITGVESVSTTSATFNAELTLSNPAYLSLPVRHGAYTVSLNRSGTVLGSGTIPPFTLDSRTDTTTPFSHEVTWQATGELGQALLTQERVLIDITGNATIPLLVTGYTAPFSHQFDLKQYVREQLQNRARSIADALQEEAENVVTDASVTSDEDETDPSGITGDS